LPGAICRCSVALIGKPTLTALAAAAALATSGCATGITSTPDLVGPNEATIAGKVVSNAGGQVEYWAEFGPTTGYGSETPHQTVTVAQNTPRLVYVTISGLQRATTYHYRLCASDSQQQGGPGCGDDKTVTTQTYGCGETVTTSFKLTGNLNCLQQPGFVVGADGIDVNLGGRVLYGGIASGGGGPIGIDNTGGFDDVTVRNGTVAAFGFGIETAGASRNHILNVTGSSAGTQVTIEGGDSNEIRHGDMFGRSWGIRASGSSGLIVADTSSAGAFGSGIQVNGDGARIVRNRGVVTGVAASDVSGIRLIGSGARVAANYVDGPWPAGGISILGANDAIVDNTVVNAAPLFSTGQASDGDGIFIGAFSGGITLRGNQSNGNAGDGIDVRASGTSLESNQAFGNGGWGILAVPGVTDLGGNAGGGSAGDCQNVFCP
jgi:parallel beta-helix repeat protein